MEIMNVMYELAESKTSLQIADRTIQAMNKQVRKLKGKCIYKNLLIAGLVWFGATACKMLGESDKRYREAEEDARKLKAALAHTQQVLDEVNRNNAKQFWAEDSVSEQEPEKDICCDGCATITKKDV
jgi:hypothetical protein